ncbi:DUF1080 domain-containing protein [bacterium]|nr:DUF1080 domain-containing protein [bacterium]
MTVTTLPESFGRYRVLKLLGRGGMGAVYLAEDTQLHRQVALKIPTTEGTPSSELLERHYREARLAATLRNSHICPVYDVGEIDGIHFISMAYIEGEPLSKRIPENGWTSERQVLSLIRKLALALQSAHDLGILHRDLKPANIMLDRQREPVIMDFGLARQMNETAARLTQSGVIVGSPAYMSPEHVEGQPDKLSGAADQYSLGVILYELLTGRLPFRGSISAVIGQILSQPPPSPRDIRADLDPRVAGLCQRMLAKSPHDRYPSLKSVAEEITRILKSPVNSSPSATPESVSSTSRKADTQKSAELSVLNRERWNQEIPALLKLAENLFRKHDYSEVCRVLGQIPPGFRNQDVEQLLTKASEYDDECCLLLNDIEQVIKQESAVELGPMLKRLLQLKPGHKGMQELAHDVARYGVERALRIRRKDHQYLDPAGRTIEPKHVIMAFGGLVALCAAVYFGTLAYVQPTGTVLIEVKNPGIAISFADANVSSENTGQRIRVPVAENIPLSASVDGVPIHAASQTLSVNKQETKTITARLLPDHSLEVTIAGRTHVFATPQSVAGGDQPENPDNKLAAPQADPWISLFNGQDLSGWRTNGQAWQVQNQVLEILPVRMTGKTHLETTESYSDFELRLQFRLLNQGAISLGFRFGRDDVGWNLGPQLNLGYFGKNDFGKENETGNLFALLNRTPTTLVKATDKQRDVYQPALHRGDWIDVYLRCEGPRIIAEINGQRTVDYTDTASQLPLSGTIDFYTPGSQPVSAEVRDIRLRELKTSATPVAPLAMSAMPQIPTDQSDSSSLPKGPRILFEDDYSSPKPYWSNTTAEQLKENPDHSWGFRDGVYFDEVRATSWYFGFLPGGPYKECSWEMAARVTGDNPSSRGSLVVHLIQSGRGIQLRLDGHGLLWIAPSSVTFDTFSAGPWLGPIQHTAIKSGGGAYNNIRLEARKRRLDVIVNDVAVIPPLEFEWDLTPFSIGLGVDCQSPAVRAEWDKNVIRELDSLPTDSAETKAQIVRFLSNGAARLPDGTVCYEGASLKRVEVNGGSANPQWDLQAFQGVWTNDMQVLWTAEKAGHSLTWELPVATEGLYDIVAGFTLGPDFGRFRFTLDDQPLPNGKAVELFDPRVQPAKPISLGTLPLTPGKKRLTATVIGKHRASTGFFLGLDELRLVPAK